MSWRYVWGIIVLICLLTGLIITVEGATGSAIQVPQVNIPSYQIVAESSASHESLKSVTPIASAKNLSCNVTIEASGTQPFHTGNKVTLSGLNTVSDSVYLFMTGQDLPGNGGSLNNPLEPVISDQPATFTSVSVSDNYTWVYNWTIPHDITHNGDYLLYAEAAPKNLTNIGETIAGSILISLVSDNFSDSIHLLPGWNFISTPVTLQNDHNTMDIFAGVNSSGHSILTYEGRTASWITMKATDSFDPLMGIWVYSSNNYQVPLVYNNVTNSSRNLVTGWNTFGITPPDRPIGQALSSIQRNWSYLVGYNATLQQYTNPFINENLSANPGLLKTKDGFWIYMKENGTYTG